MSHGLEKKRHDAGGWPVDSRADVPAGVVVERIRSLIRTWSQFGTGGEDNMIAELNEALGTDANR